MMTVYSDKSVTNVTCVTKESVFYIFEMKLMVFLSQI